MKGHIRERSPGHWAIVIDARDAATGKRKRKWHSVKGGKRAAQKEAARLIAEIGRGTYIERSRMSVAEFVASRIDQWQAAGEISTRSAERYRSTANCQIAPHIGSRPLQKLTRLDLEAWHTALRNTGLAARTIGIAHRLLGTALRDAERDGLVVRNVAKLQRAPKVEAEEVVIVRDVPALLEALKGLQLYPIVVAALFTGMRLGELLALRDGRLDLDRGVIQVREALEPTAGGIQFKAPKTRAGRRDITLPAIVVETLREHRRELLERRLRLGLGRLGPDDLLFTSPDGGPAKPNSVSVGWSRFADRIGMPEVTFHALRHTHASQLIAQGVDIVTISKRLGHANPNVTLGIYAHLFATDDSRASVAINSALGSIR
jgi:integrase